MSIRYRTRFGDRCMQVKSVIIVLLGAISLLSALDSAYAEEVVKTQSGCSVFLIEAPPPNISLRWDGRCDTRGLATGNGTLHASGGDMLAYTETGRMSNGSKIGNWFRKYDSIGIELRFSHIKNFPRGVDVHKVSGETPTKRRRAYAFLNNVAQEGDFASSDALSVVQLEQPAQTASTKPNVTAQPSPAAQPPNASTSPAHLPTPPESRERNVASCGAEVLIEKPGSRGGGMKDMEGFRIVNSNPPKFENLYGTRFANDGLPGSGTTQWQNSELNPTNIPGMIEGRQKEYQYIEDNCSSSTPGYCETTIANNNKLLSWLRCTSFALGYKTLEAAASKAHSTKSYWDLAGSRVFLAYYQIPPGPGSGDQLPLGAYVGDFALVTGPSAAAVQQRLGERYRNSRGQVMFVNSRESLDRHNSPAEISFGVLRNSCGPGYIAGLIDGSAKHGRYGFGRLVTIGCGSDAQTAMVNAINECKSQGGCSPQYPSSLVIELSVVQWDGQHVGALGGTRGGSGADVGKASRQVGGCGIQRSGSVNPTITPTSTGPVTPAHCRELWEIMR
jgi:hypothetical protein